MNIKRLVIENFKSIERIELIEPNPFTVFVGPNGSGKSNIFEALEFFNTAFKAGHLAESLFEGRSTYTNRNKKDSEVNVNIGLQTVMLRLKNNQEENKYQVIGSLATDESRHYLHARREEQNQFLLNFTRLFIANDKLVKSPLNDNQRLSLSAKNLEKALKRLLSDNITREDIFEWLYLFIPGFESVEINDRDELHWYEKGVDKYFTKDLISDGTYNILALLTAVYQSDGPQFLCIEEPENGLHPEVLESLINFFRNQCIEKGHYIWVNTHSESIVKLLTTDEIILVNKRDGGTQTKQVKGMNIYNLTTDEAWLSGALGGGLAW